MKGTSRYRIITNNPLVQCCLPEPFLVELHAELGYREVLVLVRDLVYAGHRLYTHPLAGSVKPNETPYKSVVISRLPGGMDPEEAVLIAEGIGAFDKFIPKGYPMTRQMHRDFQLIDYALLCGALQLDAVAGLHNKERSN